jgi:hypothetical protein
MGSSAVQICSNASLMLGGRPINDLNDDTDRARLASNLFPMVRNYVLRSHPWNCCIKRVTLSPDTAAPGFDFAFQFTLPSDYMRTLSVGEIGCEATFKIESGKLLSDDNPCLLRYVSRNENPATWDDMLVMGMTMAMKAVMAYPITQSTSLEQLVDQAVAGVLQRARSVDGQDDTPEALGDSPLLQSRFGTGNAGFWRGGR